MRRLTLIMMFSTLLVIFCISCKQNNGIQYDERYGRIEKQLIEEADSAFRALVSRVLDYRDSITNAHARNDYDRTIAGQLLMEMADVEYILHMEDIVDELLHSDVYDSMAVWYPREDEGTKRLFSGRHHYSLCLE